MARLQQSPQAVRASAQKPVRDLDVSHRGGDRLLRVRDVADQVGLSKAYVFELVAAGKFPKPTKLTPNVSRWSELEIQRWISEKLAARGVQ